MSICRFSDAILKHDSPHIFLWSVVETLRIEKVNTDLIIDNISPTLDIRTIGSGIRQSYVFLKLYSDTALQDAQVLLAHITGHSRAWVLAHPEAKLEGKHREVLVDALTHLANGEPLPYILGEWEFFGKKYFVTPDVLIPRPETELLVEDALKWLADHPGKRRVGDVGTGSGCIAVSLATNCSDLVVIASDISPQACLVAMDNVLRHDLCGQVAVVNDDLLSVARGPFDLLCANLPYIPKRTLQSLRVLDYEPKLALDGGMDGLLLIRRLLEVVPSLLAPSGAVLLEIEAGQADHVRALVEELLPHSSMKVLFDLAGFPRVVRIET
jgi:release factor glutamine methyltransferase